jgi:hypothetical protein
MAFLHLPPIRWLTSFYNPPNCFIEHPRGLILIDTGWNKANRDHQL